ncbi:MAG: ribosome maturation factor RimM [Clostridiales bacterium]|jgi:16S rRNA processing protein RimM|nr:ribosome maturation factor RimM [Clostridiales bacterium]
MDFYRIAVVVRAHGVRGGVKLLPLTDDTARFESLKSVYLEHGGKRSAVRVTDTGVRPDAVTLRIEGVNTPEEANALRGAYLAVDRAHARQLPADTWFVADLIGCEVVDTAGSRLGVVREVLRTGANDVYELDTGTLIPALKRVLREVDTQAKRIVCDSAVLREVAVFAN